MRPLQGTTLSSGHVLPATIAQEAVIAAGDELGAILQRHPVRGLNRLPVGQHRRVHVPAVVAAADRPVDFVTGPQVSQWLRPAVSHQDRRLSRKAVNATMATAPVGIDGPAERNPGGLRHPVDDAARMDLEERHAAKPRRVERPGGDRAALEQGGCAAARAAGLASFDPHPIPAHNGHYRMCIRAGQRAARRSRPGSRLWCASDFLAGFRG